MDEDSQSILCIIKDTTSHSLLSSKLIGLNLNYFLTIQSTHMYCGVIPQPLVLWSHLRAS